MVNVHWFQIYYFSTYPVRFSPFACLRLYGDYESLNDGRSADALVDFTGGVAEKLVLTRLDLNDTKIVDQLFYKLKESCDNSALMNCNIEVRSLYRNYDFMITCEWLSF